eukprot:4449575-Pyramimonas_sp.AAC.1
MAGVAHPSRPRPCCGVARTSVPASAQCPLLIAQRQTSLRSGKSIVRRVGRRIMPPPGHA